MTWLFKNQRNRELPEELAEILVARVGRHQSVRIRRKRRPTDAEWIRVATPGTYVLRIAGLRIRGRREAISPEQLS